MTTKQINQIAKLAIPVFLTLLIYYILNSQFVLAQAQDVTSCYAPNCATLDIGFGVGGTGTGGGTACGGTAPAQANGIVIGTGTYSGTYTPNTWTYDNSASAATPCKWKCSTTFHQSGNTCAADVSGAGGGTACGGTAPTSANGIVIGRSTYSGTYTPNTWTYDNSASAATPCKWKCSATFHQSGNTCAADVSGAGGGTACGGTAPTSANGIVIGTGTYSGTYTPNTWTYDNSASAATPCKWKCSTTFHQSGNTCAADVSGAGGGTACGGAAPAQANGIVIGRSTYSGTYTPNTWTYDNSASAATPCKWKCSATFHQSGNTCAADVSGAGGGTACGGTAPTSANGIVIGTRTYSGTYTPNTGTYQNIPSAPTPGKWKCSATFHQSGNTCAADVSGAGGGTACGGTAPTSANGIVIGTGTYSGTHTPNTLTNDNSASAATPCKWKCSTTFHQSGNTCAADVSGAGGGTACGGTAPTSANGIVIGTGTYSGTYTPNTWTYDNSASAATPCKWKCSTTFHQSGNTCAAD